ncbi:hypothetical protein ACVW19_003520 [Streptomyces sp. TE5632]
MSTPPTTALARATAAPSAALRVGRGTLFLRRAVGRLLPLEVDRWCARGRAVLGIDVGKAAVDHTVRLGRRALLRYAQGWERAGQWTAGGRCFAALRSRSASSSAEPPKRTAVTSSQRARNTSADSPVPSR